MFYRIVVLVLTVIGLSACSRASLRLTEAYKQRDDSKISLQFYSNDTALLNYLTPETPTLYQIYETDSDWELHPVDKSGASGFPNTIYIMRGKSEDELILRLPERWRPIQDPHSVQYVERIFAKTESSRAAKRTSD
ncbi:hypothetical protein [Nibricoccus aquaticus]|uniref:hypothetical protein n=1 Tax=Nibricoccus aquaticus TaxID=2576891 RepID=UPI0010FED2FB|nr:hypothetical protein [Nibricoccus aquaticus]